MILIDKAESIKSTVIEYSLSDMEFETTIIDKGRAKEWVKKNFHRRKKEYLDNAYNQSYVVWLRTMYKREVQNRP